MKKETFTKWLLFSITVACVCACGGGNDEIPIPPNLGDNDTEDITCHVGFDNSAFPTIYENGTYTHQIFLGFGVSKGHYSAGIDEFGIAVKTSDGTITNSKKSGDVYVSNLYNYKYFSGLIFDDKAYEWGTILFVSSKSKKVVLDYYVRYYNSRTQKWIEGSTNKRTYEPQRIVGDNNGGDNNGVNNSISYTIDGETFKTILVDGGTMDPFYIMQTEIVPNKEIIFGNTKISRTMDMNLNGTLVTSELYNFILEVREKTGLPWRLPTKDEWLYAASGGAKKSTYKYSGSDIIDDVAWYKGNCKNGANSVAKKKANALGLYDMSGNYAELVFNVEAESEGNVDGDYYGGCWKDAANECTVTSYKKGSTTGKIEGTNSSETMAVNCKIVSVRLVYNKYNK